MTASEWWWVVGVVLATVGGIATQVPRAAAYAAALVAFGLAAVAVGFLVLP